MTQLKAAQAEIQSSLTRAMQSAQSESQRAIIDVERTFLSNDWTGIGAKLDHAFKPGDCTPLNWMSDVAVVFGWAKQVREHTRNLVRCDPLSSIPAYMLAQWEIWSGNPQAGVESANRYLKEQGFHPWVDDSRFQALLATGHYQDDPDILDDNPEGSIFPYPRKILVYAMDNDLVKAHQVLDTWRAAHAVDDLSALRIYAPLGKHQSANQYASRIDARFGGAFALTEAISHCMCGAPFDLDAAPNFKKRIEEAGFPWPPSAPYKFPAKDW